MKEVDILNTTPTIAAHFCD